jgi:hypothetical protein
MFPSGAPVVRGWFLPARMLFPMKWRKECMLIICASGRIQVMALCGWPAVGEDWKDSTCMIVRLAEKIGKIAHA